MDQRKLLPLTDAAVELQVSSRWLREEAEAGRIPCLRAGKRLLFHVRRVEVILEKRALQPTRRRKSLTERASAPAPQAAPAAEVRP